MNERTYWMAAHGEIELDKSEATPVHAWAVGMGDKEIAWFRDYDDALAFKELKNGKTVDLSTNGG
jgi:hypothetical protein